MISRFNRTQTPKESLKVSWFGDKVSVALVTKYSQSECFSDVYITFTPMDIHLKQSQDVM